MSSLFIPLKQAAKSGFEGSVGSGETQKCFQAVLLYCCDISEAKNLYALCHGVGRPHPRVRCHTKYKDMTTGRERWSLVEAESLETRRKMQKLLRQTGNLAGRDPSTRKWTVMDERSFFLSEQLLTGWSSFLEEACRGDGEVVENL